MSGRQGCRGAAPAAVLAAALLATAGVGLSAARPAGAQSEELPPAAISSEETLVPIARGFWTGYALPGRLRPYAIARGPDGALWLTFPEPRRLGRFDPATGAFWTAELPPGLHPALLSVGPDGGVWISDWDFTAESGDDFLVRFEPSARAFRAYAVPTPNAGPMGMAWDAQGRLWFSQFQGGRLGVLAPGEGVILEIPLPSPRGTNPGPLGLAVTADAVWVAASYDDGLLRVVLAGGEPAGQIQAFAAPQGFYSPVAVVVDGGGNVWTTEHGGDRLLRLDPTTRTAQLVSVPPPPPDIYPVAGINDLQRAPDGGLWFTAHFAGRVGRYEPATGGVVEYPLPEPGGLPQWLAVDPGGGVWVAAYGHGMLWRLDPAAPGLTLAAPARPVRVRAGGTARLRLAATPGPGFGGEPGSASLRLIGEPRGLEARFEPPDWSPGQDKVTVTLEASRAWSPGEVAVMVAAEGEGWRAVTTVPVEVVGAALYGLWGMTIFLALAVVGLGGWWLWSRYRAGR